MLKALKHCLLLITFVSAVAQQSDEITKPINTAKITDKTVDVNLNSDQDQDSDNNAKLTELCKEFFIDAAQLKLFDYLITSAITIAHELGHATAIKSLFNVHNSVQIHIGTNTPEKIPKLFSLGNMHFYKKFPWACGLTKSGEISLENNKMAYQKMLRCIARASGGISGGTFMYSLLLAVTNYCAYCDDKDLYEITLKSFINAASPFSYILNTKSLSLKQKRFLLNATFVICLNLIYEFFYGLTPLQRLGDGWKIWKDDIGINNSMVQAGHFIATLGICCCWVALIKKYCNARKNLSPKISRASIPAALFIFLT